MYFRYFVMNFSNMVNCWKIFFLVIFIVFTFRYHLVNFFMSIMIKNMIMLSNQGHQINNSSTLHYSKNETFVQRNFAQFDRKPIYPWKGDPQCHHFTIQLAKRDSLLKWPLTSFPGSGVTWTRQLIEGVTGIYTGSVYDGDPSPILSPGNEKSNTDDPLCGCTIIDKDHEATITTSGLASYFELLHRYGNAGIVHQQYDKRGVLLLRNPMDVVFAYRNWVYGGKTGKAPLEAFKGPLWDETVEYVAYVWADHAIRWIEQIENGTVLFYEKLQGKTADTEIKRVLSVLEFKSMDINRMRCTLKHRNRKDHMRINETRMFLEPQHRMKLMKAIHHVQQSLRRKGWPRLPIYLYDFHSLDGNL